MQKRKQINQWDVIFGISLVVMCCMLVFTTVSVFRQLQGVAPAPAETSTAAPAAEKPVTAQQTITTVAAAHWAPAPRKLEQRTAVLKELDAGAAQALIEKGFGAVVLPALEAYSQEEAQAAGEVLTALGAEGVYRVLTLDPVDENALANFRETLGTIIETTSFDALLLPDLSDQAQGSERIAQFTADVVQLLEDANLELPVMFELGRSKAAEYREAVQEVTGGVSLAEFLVTLAPDEISGFTSWVKRLAGEDGESPLVTAQLDIKDAIPNGTVEETIAFFKALQSLADYPLVLRAADYVPKNSQAAQLLTQFFNGSIDYDFLNRGLSLKSPLRTLKREQTIYTSSATVNFTGGSNPLYPVTLNEKELTRSENGDFSVDMPLSPGKNSFLFAHQGTQYTVTVVYEVKVLESVSPTSLLEATGGTELTVSAVAIRGASVTASLAGQSITLKPGASGEEDEADRSAQANEDFITYEGVFRLPASTSKRYTVGTVKYHASYNGLSEGKNGALVEVLPKVVVPVEPETSAPTTTTTTTTSSSADSSGSSSSGSSSSGSADSSSESSSSASTSTSTAASTLAPSGALLTPGSNHGLGTAKMAEITANHANARLNTVLNEKSVPTSSPLLAGTYDYITGSDTINGNTYYHLSSGKRVKSTDLKVLSSGYKLPLNVIKADGKTENGALTLRMNLSWKVPFNVNLTGQSYSSSQATSGYTWGVSSYTATGLEIVFYQTSGYSGSIDVSSFPLVSGATWSKDSSNNTVTLKLSFSSAGKFYGYQAVYEGSQLVIRLGKKPSASLSGAVIVLDPGHGGKDGGSNLAASHTSLSTEKQVNLLIANKVKALLTAKGATVHMTRSSDVYVSPLARTEFTRGKNPDMFVSIHCDSTTTASPMGTSAFYYRPYSQPLAKAINTRMVSAYKSQIYTSSNYSNYLQLQGGVDRGYKFYPFEVTRIEECPSVLIECGFGSNLTECRVLQNDSYQSVLAQAIANGIADYLTAAQ